MRSDKPQAKEAKAFQDWVTRVVLPAIHKGGAYGMGEDKVAADELSEDELVMRAMSIMYRKVERLSLERDRLAQNNQLLTTIWKSRRSPSPLCNQRPLSARQSATYEAPPLWTSPGSLTAWTCSKSRSPWGP